MGKPIQVPYVGFRRLIDEYKKRLYYFIFPNGSLELNFLSDSFIVSTILKAEEIDNKEVFFQQEMFYGSERLTAPMTFMNSVFDVIGEGIKDVVKENESEEQKQNDPDFNTIEEDKDESVE